MMNRYVKPYKTYREQVQLLSARGLNIDDPAEAERVLSVVGYYRLSGYWYPFRAPGAAPGDSRSSHYVPGVELHHVLALYEMDRRLKLLTMDAIERVEIAMRVRLGHTLGARHAYAHLDRGHLDGWFTGTNSSGKCVYDEWLRLVTVAQQRSKEDFVQHFERRYDGRLPIWVLTEIMDFGSLSYLYDGAKRVDRDAIATSLGVTDVRGSGNGAALANWMRVLNYLRNTCAHHSRLWNRNMTVQIAPKHLWAVPDLEHVARDDPSALNPSATRNRVYGALTVLAFLMRQIHDESAWCAQVRAVIDTGMADSGRSAREMGCPAEWEVESLWSA